MRRTGGMIVGGMLAAFCVSGCLSNSGLVALGPPKISDNIMKGGQFIEPWLGAALKEAQKAPLGSKANPVRGDRPAGQHDYLARLRCVNGAPPTYKRVGNLGAGVFGSIVDQYDVRCEGSAPPRSIIVMDMYFAGYIESRPIKGFEIAPP